MAVYLAMKDLRTPVRDVVGFTVTTFVLSWSWLLAIGLTGRPVEAGQGWPTHFPALAGPLVAAVAVTGWTTGRAGLAELWSRMSLWRVPWRWWGAALIPVAAFLLTLLALGISRGEVPDLGGLAVFTGLPTALGAVGVLVAVVLVNGFGEETGWRGFALPRLQRRMDPLPATLVLAAIWALWHAPMFVVVSSFEEMSIASVTGWLIGLFCGAVVATWLYNGSGGSILLVAVWHGTYNVAAATGLADTGSGAVAAAVTTVIMVQAVVLVVLELRLHHRGRSVLDSRHHLAPA